MYQKQINTGVEFLNNIVPDWLDRVDPSSLDIASERYCVIGHIAISMNMDAYNFCELHNMYLVLDGIKLPCCLPEMGFSIGEDADSGDWSILTEQWKVKIQELKNDKRTILPT